MGSVIKRGTRARPRYYGQFKTAQGTLTNRALKGVKNAREARDAVADIETRIRKGLTPFPSAQTESTLAPLLERWRDGLRNRNAKTDQSRITRHLIPKFGKMAIERAAALPVTMHWIDDLAATKLAPASQRLVFNLWSRFWSWAILMGHATTNPCRMVPQGARPQDTQKRDLPWLNDETIVVKVMEALPRPVDLMFYIGNRSGLRMGEICGLHMSDLDHIGKGFIVVRNSYGGLLKEDKAGTGKAKKVPAPEDAVFVLKTWLSERRLAGATAESLVFPYVPEKPQHRRRTSPWTGYRKEYLEQVWEQNARAIALGMSWYQSTRHAFVSRALNDGAPLDEVSAAVGHSSPTVTKKYYDHFVRETFSASLRRGLPTR
ncbi:MAG: site-specific integrase [Myxococcales bacterium]